MKRNRVKVGGSWAYFDQLDGKTIEHGEALSLTWPDGSALLAPAVVEQSTHRGTDMGNPYDYPVSSAYVAITVRGQATRIRLRDLPDVLVERAVVK